MHLYFLYVVIVYLYVLMIKQNHKQDQTVLNVDAIYFDDKNFVIQVVDGNLGLRKRLPNGVYVTGFCLTGNHADQSC
jgi:hypothetical protein